MSLKEGHQISIGEVPDNAVFSFLESATPSGIKYQRVGKEIWQIGFTRFPEQDVRSGRPELLNNMRWLTEVKIEKLLQQPLPHVPKAEKTYDFSFYAE